MDSRSDAAEPSDTIVVAGEYSDDSQVDSDDSFDAYGEDEQEEQEQEQNEPDSVNDDYANTFDSPAEREHQSEASEARQDVSEAAVSMNNSSTPEKLKSQSPPPAPTSVLSPPRPPALAATNGLARSSSVLSENGSSDALSTAPSAASTFDAGPSALTGVVSEAVEPMTSVASPSTDEEDDDHDVDIQKLVDDITARANSSTSVSAAVQAPGSARPTQAVSAPASNVPATPNLSTSSTLPPKPSVSHHTPSHLPAIPPAQSFQSRNNPLLSPIGSQSNPGPAAQRGLYLSSGAPGTSNDGFSSLPPPPPSINHAHNHALTSSTSAHHFPPQSPVQPAWETFLIDEKRYTTEAKWERFPEGSRIFIG